MSRSRRLILSIYRGSSLTQLFIRRECRLCSSLVVFSSPPSLDTREDLRKSERARRDRLCNSRLDSLTVVLYWNKTPIELRTCYERERTWQGAFTPITFSATWKGLRQAWFDLVDRQSCNFDQDLTRRSGESSPNGISRINNVDLELRGQVFQKIAPLHTTISQIALKIW